MEEQRPLLEELSKAAAAMREHEHFGKEAARGNFTKESTELMLAAASVKDANALYHKYKAYKKMKDVLTRVWELSMPLITAEAAEPLVAFVQSAEEQWCTVANTMGELTAVQALYRTLTPGETRKHIVARAREGLRKENMVVAPALESAIEATLAQSG